MASTGNSSDQISLRIMVDKDENRVLFAEAGKEFVDIVLSFLTMPLGTIARLVRKDSNLKGVTFGCFTSLHQSVENLDLKYFRTDACKEMLLHPRNPMESHCRSLKINIDDTEPTMYFVCENNGIHYNNVPVATFRNQACSCGKIMGKEIPCDSSIIERQKGDGYVDEDASFVIFDDLRIKSCDDFTSLGFLRNHCIKHGPILEQTVIFTQTEVLDLLKYSLFSSSPLTHCLARKMQNQAISNPYEWCCLNIKEESISENNKKVKVKLMVIKPKKRVMFAEVDEDFMDLLLSFLTSPLTILNGHSNFGCMDKLYNSVIELNVKNFKCEEVKNMLVNPVVAPFFKVNNQVLPIHEVKHSGFGCFENNFLKTMRLTVAQESSEVRISSSIRYVPVTMLDPKGKARSGGGFIVGGSKFFVTDQLSVKPYSLISVVSFLNDSEEQESDLEEIIINIGVREALSILKASMTSSSALTVGLGPFIKYIEE